jgi:DNA-binding response OmpR family regulator
MSNAEKQLPAILIVEDEDWIRAGMKREVERHGYAVVEAKDDAEALAAAEREAIVLILTEEEVPAFAALMERRRENLALSTVPVAIINPDAEEGTHYGDAYLIPDYTHIARLITGQP